MEKLIIIGAGGLGKEVKWFIDQNPYLNSKYQIEGFIDDSYKENTEILGIPVIGNMETLTQSPKRLVIAINNPQTRLTIERNLRKQGHYFPNIVDESLLNPTIKLGQGNIIFSPSLMTANLNIGDFNVIHYFTTISHDVQIHSYCSIMPSVNISGHCIVEDYVQLGVGSKIIQGIEIAEGSIVGAGATVVNNIDSYITVVGTPAKKIKVLSRIH